MQGIDFQCEGLSIAEENRPMRRQSAGEKARYVQGVIQE